MLELRNIDKTFHRGTVNEAPLFRNFSLHVSAGDFVSVVGSNGSGKTTLLNLISGTVPTDSGEIWLCGEDITRQAEYRRAVRIGRVYQDPAVGTVPGMTIYENLSVAENKNHRYTLGLMLNRRKYEEFRELVRTLGLGLEEKMNIPVGLLSGGQRQALSLLMSTMTPIEFLILDEHTAALDPKTAEVIMQLTGRIVAEKKLTTIMVTHNLRYAVEYGDRVLMMHQGHAELDLSGEARRALRVEDLLQRFNEISVECGN